MAEVLSLLAQDCFAVVTICEAQTQDLYKGLNAQMYDFRELTRFREQLKTLKFMY